MQPSAAGPGEFLPQLCLHSVLWCIRVKLLKKQTSVHAILCVSYRRYEMVFEYTPNSDTLYESFWTFSIPSQGILVPFMLVGNVAEPRVSLDRPAINFGQVSCHWYRVPERSILNAPLGWRQLNCQAILLWNAS